MEKVFASIGWTYAASHAAYLLFLFAILHATRPAFLAFRKKRSGFGTVFNSVTGLPESMVTVRLRDLHGQVVRTAVTDKLGRYRLMAPKGEYYVDLIKPGFSFPSAYLSKKRYSPVYDNLLPTQHIIVKDYGAITKNIPIDPAGAAAKTSVFKAGLRLSKRAQYAIAVLGPFAAGVVAALINSWIAWCAFAIFIFIFLGRLLSFKPSAPPFGTVRDAVTSHPLPQAVIRILDSRFNKVLETQVTSPKGRYAFIVHPGSYRVFIKRKGYKGVILNYPKIKQDGYLIAKDVKLKRAPAVKPRAAAPPLPPSL